MSKLITVKLQEEILKKADELAPKSLQKNRNAYINEAVKRFNQWQERSEMARQLANESMMVRDESMQVLSEFESFGDSIIE